MGNRRTTVAAFPGTPPPLIVAASTTGAELRVIGSATDGGR